MRVKLLGTCLVDTFFPDAGEAVVKLLRYFGVDVVYPKDQTCCGKPPNSAGYVDEARHAARHFISVFQGDEPIVIPSGSCASMVKIHYPELFENDPVMKEKAENTARRAYELTQFLVHVLKAHESGLRAQGRITYHASCQLTRELGVREEPLLLLGSLQGSEFVHLAHADRCCGFGGTFMGKLPEVSMAIADEKAETIIRTKADTVTGCDLGCLMNIKDALKRAGSEVQVKHIAEVIAEGL
ncbi:MAG: (Fe-S)-binding protein [Desulfomonile tiedjei]|uniref:(Fe-S)-binding protein n=1 Tax=Desulfomonile tiedjei TaxID=2358 RepID=A0A9D6V4L7_9BACT|nr:(Fe-S)-binding protein [Desulfomonile tiedjei]